MTRLFCFFIVCFIVGCNWETDINKSTDARVLYAPKEKKSLIINNYSEPESLDPQSANGIPEGNILRDISEGLVQTDIEGNTVPAVAQSWENKDSKIWIFHLKKEAKWSNGDPVTADDFVYSWRRLVNPNTASIYASYLVDAYVKNAESIITGNKLPESLGVYALDKHTFMVELEKPVPYFLDMLVHYSVYPVHQKTIEKFGKNWLKPENFVGNGAYQLDKWEVNNRIVLKRNEFYWDNLNTKIEEIVYLPISSQISDVVFYMSNREDISNEALPIEIFQLLQKKYQNELRIKPQLCSYVYYLNLTKPPFNDIRVRKALTLVLDRELITSKIMKQGQKISYTFTPQFVKDFTYIEPEWAKWTDQKKTREAQRLLKEAGYSEKKPLSFEILTNSLEQHKTIALAAASIWKNKLKFVEVKLDNKEWKSYADSKKRGDFTMARFGWCADYNEPSSFLNVYKSNNSNNSNGYRSKKFDDLLKQTLEPDVDEYMKKSLYIQAERQLLQDIPYIALFTSVSPRLIKSYVKGFTDKNPLEKTKSKDLYFEYEPD